MSSDAWTTCTPGVDRISRQTAEAIAHADFQSSDCRLVFAATSDLLERNIRASESYTWSSTLGA